MIIPYEYIYIYHLYPISVDDRCICDKLSFDLSEANLTIHCLTTNDNWRIMIIHLCHVFIVEVAHHITYISSSVDFIIMSQSNS